MAKLTAQQAADKQAKNLKASTQYIQSGVQAVTKAPGQSAAAKSDKMRQNILAAIDSGTWAKNVAAVPLSDWQSAMINKGIPRISAGIDAANGKVAAFFTKLLPYQDNLKSQISSMPDLTLEDNINRMTTFVRGMSQFSK